MTNPKQYDLEDRTLNFAKSVRDFCTLIPKTISNGEYIKQIIRSSASIGANYIEANESLGKKDFIMRVRISRKEAKETRYWLALITVVGEDHNKTRVQLSQEALELLKILSSILDKSQ